MEKQNIIRSEDSDDGEDIKRIQENCELISKYFFLIDKKIFGKDAVKRIISPCEDLLEYINAEIDLYYEFITGKDKKNFDRFVIMLVELYFYQIAANGIYPPEDVMINIINQIGNNFNYDSNKYLSEVFAYYFIDKNYSKIFMQINDKLGVIIFNQNAIFIDYILKMFDVNDNLMDKEVSICEKDLLIFIKEKNNFFNIPEERLINLNSLSEYLSNCTKMDFDSEKNKNNDSKDSDEKTQETEGKKEIKNEGSPNATNKNGKENENDFSDKILKLTQQINEMKMTYDKRFSDLTEENSRLSKNQLTLNTKVKNLEEKLFNIQSRDLWKQIVNYNLYHLNIEKTGDYDERIGKIISKLKTYKNSGLYIRFFKDVNDIINKGNLRAHDFEKKIPIGLEPNYIDVLFKNQVLPRIASSEVKFVKKILKEIKVEAMLQRYLLGIKAIDENEKEFDFQKILSMTEIHK